MGLLVASALISIRGGHWPRLAYLLSDWLRGGLIFFFFPAKRPPLRTLLPRGREGPGVGRGGGSPTLPFSRSCGVGEGAQRTPLPLPNPHHPQPSRRGAAVSRRGGAWRPTQNLSPGGLLRGGSGAQTFRDPSSPRLPWALLAEGPRAQKPPTPGPLSLVPGGPQEDCGPQPAGRFPSQRPHCPYCCELRPWPLGTAWPFLLL